MENVEQFIKTLSFWKSLIDDERSIIVKSMEMKTVVEGATFFEQGDQGDTFYIVGQCDVTVRSSGFLKAGDEVHLLNEWTSADKPGISIQLI